MNKIEVEEGPRPPERGENFLLGQLLSLMTTLKAVSTVLYVSYHSMILLAPTLLLSLWKTAKHGAKKTIFTCGNLPSVQR